MTEVILASIVLAACLAMLLHWALGPRWTRGLDTLLRRLRGRAGASMRNTAERCVSRYRLMRASRVARQAIRRAKAAASRTDGAAARRTDDKVVTADFGRPRGPEDRLH